MSIKALIPGVIARASRAGIKISYPDAAVIAAEMIKLSSYDDRLVLLDERLSELYDAYHMHLFLTKRPDYQVTING